MVVRRRVGVREPRQSSLAYLKRFPADELKIDKTFLDELPDSAEDAAIYSAIVTLAQRLGLQVVAEGVETDAQLRFLQRLQCNEVQGYLVGQPIPPDQFAAWLRDNPRVRIRRPAKYEPVTAPSVAAG